MYMTTEYSRAGATREREKRAHAQLHTRVLMLIGSQVIKNVRNVYSIQSAKPARSDRKDGAEESGKRLRSC